MCIRDSSIGGACWEIVLLTCAGGSKDPPLRPASTSRRRGDEVGGRRQAQGDTPPPAAATHGARGYRPIRRSACARLRATPPRSARPVVPAAEYPPERTTRPRESPA